jgi:hypothetical protein
LAVVIASRNEPAPSFAVFVTTTVANAGVVSARDTPFNVFKLANKKRQTMIAESLTFITS